MSHRAQDPGTRPAAPGPFLPGKSLEREVKGRAALVSLQKDAMVLQAKPKLTFCRGPGLALTVVHGLPGALLTAISRLLQAKAVKSPPGGPWHALSKVGSAPGGAPEPRISSPPGDEILEPGTPPGPQTSQKVGRT